MQEVRINTEMEGRAETVKKLMAIIKEQTGCDIKFIEAYANGEKVIYKGQEWSIEFVNSPNSYDITNGDITIKNVAFDNLSLKYNVTEIDRGELIKTILNFISLCNIRAKIELYTEENVTITGEYDFNAYTEITRKLAEFSFYKNGACHDIYHSDIYSSDLAPFNVWIQKPNN